MKDLFEGQDKPKSTFANLLLYGDNLTIMRDMPGSCVDLIYLDPPFNSQRTYNLIYKQATGLPVPEQEEAFCDAWELDAEKEEMARNMPIVLRDYDVDDGIIKFWTAWIDALRNTQPRLLAYLVYMTYRLFEMRRVLRSTGSLYLHCDPTASHYIKVIMDGVFGHKNFRSEIVWRRSASHNKTTLQYGPIHDVILFYSKSDKFTFHPGKTPYTKSYLQKMFRYQDKIGAYRLNELTGAGERQGESGQAWRGYDPSSKGRHWAIPASLRQYMPTKGEGMSTHAMLDELDSAGMILFSKDGRPTYKQYIGEGVPFQDIWAYQPGTAGVLADENSEIDQDIKWLDHEKERLGYQTQKPLGLLNRIIQTSSNEGDVVFDPFCGCGTAVYAAHMANRQWVGCDIAILSVLLVRDILLKKYRLKEGEGYKISGIPLSIEGAADLFQRDPRQFQHWAVEIAGGFCNKKHSGDMGIDGRIYFETSEGRKSMVVSVKGGSVRPEYMRELRGVLEREKDTEMGGLITLRPPTKGMKFEASQGGMYSYRGVNYPRLQIRTIEDLLARNVFDTPSRIQTLNWAEQWKLPLPKQS